MNLQDADKRFAPVSNSSTFNRILYALNLRSKKVLDLGCGYGEYLVRFGEGSLGITTTTEEAKYGKVRNIRISKGNVECIDKMKISETFEAIWMNNLFEHLLSPHAFLIKLKTVAQPNSLMILGVPVIPRVASLMKIKKFRGALAVAHVNFFTRESLMLTVERGGWKIKDVRPFVFSSKLLDKLVSFFTPHLYIVAYNDMSFTYPEKKLKEWEDEPYYRELIEIVGR